MLSALSVMAASARKSNAPPVFTLDQCLELALERSIPLANARRDEDIAEARIMQRRAPLLPSLELKGYYNRLDDADEFFTNTGPTPIRKDYYHAGAKAGQLLYSGGSIRAGLKAARDYRHYTQYESDRRRAVIVRDVHKGFYNVLYAKANVEVAAKSVAQLEEFLRQTEIKFKNDTASEFDVLSAKVKVANERPLLIAARNRLALVRASFKNLVYLDRDDFKLEGELDEPTLEISLEELYAIGLERRPELLQAEMLIRMREQDVRAERGTYQPELRVYASYSGDNPRPQYPVQDEWEWGWQAGLTASWDLFDGGLRRGRVLEKVQARAQARADLSDLERRIRLEVQNAWLTLTHAREVVVSAQGNVALAEKALDIADVRYRKGLSTYLEFTDANLALSDARLIHNKALVGYLHALADLHYACGSQDDPLPGEELDHE